MVVNLDVLLIFWAQNCAIRTIGAKDGQRGVPDGADAENAQIAGGTSVGRPFGQRVERGDNLQINNNFCAQLLDFFPRMHYYIIVVEYNFLGKENAKKLR